MTETPILDENAVSEIEARANAATEGPWCHFYPAARDFADYGVIRPPNFKQEVDGVTVDAGPAVGIRYQVEGLGKVNGADRGSIACTSAPKHRSSFSTDPQERALKLAHEQTRLDGEFIAHARDDIPALCATVKHLRAQLRTLRQQVEDTILVAQTDEDIDGFISAYHFQTGAIHKLLAEARKGD